MAYQHMGCRVEGQGRSTTIALIEEELYKHIHLNPWGKAIFFVTYYKLQKQSKLTPVFCQTKVMAALAGVGLAASLAQTLFSALQSNKEVRAMCSMFKCESQLQQLEETVRTIKALLLDVDQKRQGLTHEGQVWVEKLKDAVYDIDDLLDEFATIGHQQQWDSKKFSKKVCGFFSRNNKYFVAFNVSGEIKMLREKLDAIAKDHRDYGLKVVSDQVEKRPETWSYISDREVIGREGDKEAIVDMLLSSDGNQSLNRNYSFVNIVGIGGLGKTALAQLVYNDKRVEQAFSEKIWVCVSEDFGLKHILAKILGNKEDTLQKMQEEVQKRLKSKRYLLVLDDVWNESPEEWLTLKSSLLDMVSNVSGSKIIVTSRSKQVATSIGEKDPNLYELKGLSQENSWKLFKRLAFGEKEEEVDLDLLNLGKDIVKKCANVPLSIRVIATMLYKQDKYKWLSFRNINLAEMCRDQNSIMPTLMFSYYELPTELKCCFSFCSLFPKDHVIEKELLISLWLAQGFLAKTGNAGESMEDVGARYFTILLNRSFFQDIYVDRHKNVCSFKMHDLIHDLAVQVAGEETFILTRSGTTKSEKKIRHLSSSYASPDLCLGNTLRTYIWLAFLERYATESWQQINQVISKCKRLRVLSLCHNKISTIPDKLGRLLHLRYLDLSYNDELVILPKSIAKLHNLQILKLRHCVKLEELTEDMCKLVNLRMLDIHECEKLTHMPRGMNNMKNLHTLPQFVVGGIDLNQAQGGKLVDLQGKCLKGDLLIRIRHFSPQYMPRATKRASILKDAHLKNLYIMCSEDDEGVEINQSEVHETLVEDLCPNEDIIKLRMEGYEGSKLPSWASMMVSNVNGSRHVTSLSRFRNLKVLQLEDLANVEYIEIPSEAALTLASRGTESMTFFPVLEVLELIRMPKLKGWWRELGWREREGRGGCLVDADGREYAAESLPCFRRLRVLKIVNCKSLIYFIPCSRLKLLQLWRADEALTFFMKGGSSSSNTPAFSPRVKKLDIYNDARVMNSVLREFVGGVTDITLSSDLEMKSMGILREGFERCGRFLRKLEISCCNELDMEDEEEEGVPWKYLQSLTSLQLVGLPKMVKLPEGFKYLTSLQSLLIQSCYNLEEVGRCIGFLTSLQSLKFEGCRNLKALPECIGSLSSLQYLSIDCHKLKSFPESMRLLTSLTNLVVHDFSDELKKRCEQDGEDWPSICHIPIRTFSDKYGQMIPKSSTFQNKSIITSWDGTINQEGGTMNQPRIQWVQPHLPKWMW